jgi:DNA-binding NtrC family response regulator
MKRPIRVLLVRDSENDPLRLKRELRRGGFEPIIERVETAGAMSGSLSTKVWDLVISDFRVANFGANAALSVLKQSGLDLPFIIVSETIGEDAAVAAMKAGAHDCVMKHNLKRLGAVIERALQEAEIRRDHRRAEQRL